MSNVSINHLKIKSELMVVTVAFLALLCVSVAAPFVTYASPTSYKEGSSDLSVLRNAIPSLKSRLSGSGSVRGSFVVTLPTGDKVLVVNTSSGIKLGLETEGSGPYVIREVGNHIYVLPAGLNIRKFSPELFDVMTLKKYEHDYGLRFLPVIIMLKKPSNLLMKASLASNLPAIKDFKLNYKVLSLINSIAVKIPLKPSITRKIFQDLLKSSDVVKVMLDHIRRVSKAEAPTKVIISPKLYESVPYIGANELWENGINGSGVKVAILDTGIDPTNPDFIFSNGTTKIIANKSFVPGESVQDLHGHGTHVAGIIGGLGNYLSYIKGVAPGAEFIVAKVLSNEGFGYDDWIISGMEWAISQGADIISMSLGGTAYPMYDPLVAAVDEAFKEGVLMVIAAGNEGPSEFTIDSPGVAEGALTVGALDTTLANPSIADFSSVGPAINGTLKPDVVAPGVNIISDRAKGTYMDMPASYYHVFGSGTSMATPHVSGFAALTLELLKDEGILNYALNVLNLTKSELLKDVIVSTATDHWDEPLVYGAGVINATNLLQLVNSSELIIVDPARAELSIGNPNTTVLLGNPWSKNLTVKVEAEVIPPPGTGSVSPSAVDVTPTLLTLKNESFAEINVSVNLSQLESPGTYAVRLTFTDNSTGKSIGQALIGVDMWRSLTEKPASYVTLNVTYGGTPVNITAEGLYYFDLATGVQWLHYVYGEGNGTVELGPLYSNSVYLITVNATLNTTKYGINANASQAIVELALTLPKDPVNKTINIDLSTLPIFYVENPSDLLSAYNVFIDHTWNLSMINATNETIDAFTAQCSGYCSYAFIYGSLAINASSGSAATGVTSSVVSELDDKSQWNVGIGYFTSQLPTLGFLRFFNGLPNGEVMIEPNNFSYAISQIHAVISKQPLPELSASVYWGPMDYATLVYSYGPTGSVSVTYIDSNVSIDLQQVMGIEDAWTYVGSNYAEVLMESWLATQVSSNEVYLVPATMPRGSTAWIWMYAYPGLDNYNYTGTFISGHVFRSTLFGYMDMYVDEGAPLFNMTVNFNHGDFTHSWTSESSPYILDFQNVFYNHTAVPGGKPYMDAYLRVNLTPFRNVFSFLADKAELDVHVNVNASYSELPLLSTVFPGTGYGEGVREIIPIAGYDYLDNMVPEGYTAIYMLVFDQPYNSELLNTTVEVELLGPGGEELQLPILAWDTLPISHTVSLPVAYVAVPSSAVPPGSYGLRITGTYESEAAPTNATFDYTVSPAIYVSVSPGERATYQHVPITIIGDSGFSPENGVVGGSGTPYDPYLISGWIIDTSEGNGIFMSDVSSSFILRDITVNASNAAALNMTDLLKGASFEISNSKLMGAGGLYIYGAEEGSYGAVTDSTLSSNSSGYGIFVNGSITLNIQGSNISGWGTGVFIGKGAAPQSIKVIHSNFFGNAVGLENEGSGQVNATLDWWGDVSGPGGIGYGSGDAVYGNVSYEPWLNAPYPEGVPVYTTGGGKTSVKLNSTESMLLNSTSSGVVIYGNGTGSVEVSVMKYKDNPVGAPIKGGIKYVDIHINTSSGVSELRIRIYYTPQELNHYDESSIAPYWWNASSGKWVKYSDYSVHIGNVGSYAGYVEIIVTNSTTPSLKDLAGSVTSLSASSPLVGGSLEVPPIRSGSALTYAYIVALTSLAAASAALIIRKLSK